MSTPENGAMVKLVFGVLFLVILLAFGLALATDFRGIATRQAKASLESARPIRSLYRRDLTDEAQQRRLARATVMNRIIGLIFVLMCLSILIGTIATAG